MQEERKERVIAYIDGFNLYFGMREAGYDNCRWLNIKALVLSLLKNNQELVEIKYFTSRVSNSPDKQKRQSTYIDALESVEIQLFYGNYQDGSQECKRCGHIWRTAKEKMTDVNIATAIIVDAFQDKYDMAMLISGDSDLTPPIREVHKYFNNKRVFIAFPPKRHNSSMALVAKGSEIIGRKKLYAAQFPAQVISKTGYILKVPENWK
ncbi:MAG TPA: NYN domain-containing protein [Prolixibacteraceae bacterium]|nr:NYN domain-containing protein [Prolixibacteraceae bacterium]